MKRIALCIVALAACSKGPGITSFTADKAAAVAGDLVTLTWQVTNADKVEIDNGVGVVTGTSTAVTPVETVTYTLTASSGSASVKKTVTINVTPAPRPASIGSFTATPPQVAPGDPVKLDWTVSGDVSTQTINGQAVPVGTTTLTVNPSTLTTYTLTVTGPAAQQPAPSSVVVRVAARPVITAFAAGCGLTPTPCTSAAQGSDVTLTWAATNATTYSVSDDKGNTSFAGPLTSLTVQPSATTTYTLTATGPTGSATRPLTVTVAASNGTTLAYAAPLVATGAAVVLRQTACTAPCTTIELSLVTTKAVVADALALNLPLSGAGRVKLHLTGTAPDWTVNTSAINPGSNPPASAISLRNSGPLARVLTLGFAQKAAGGGAVTTGPAPIAPGTVLASFKLDLVPSGGTGTVFDGSGASFTLRNGPGSPSAGTLAAGTLTVN